MCARHLLLVVASGFFIPNVAESAARIDVTARIYNTASVPAGVREAALAMASHTLTVSAVEVAWKDCDLDACNRSPAAGELVVRLVRSTVGPLRSNQLILGQAAIDMGAGAGVLATIYVDCVERMAELSQTDVASLLGRAIAHELGHLLLATNAHSSSGLMRARWSQADIHRNQTADWVLAREDAEAIRRRRR